MGENLEVVQAKFKIGQIASKNGTHTTTSRVGNSTEVF